MVSKKKQWHLLSSGIQKSWWKVIVWIGMGFGVAACHHAPDKKQRSLPYSLHLLDKNNQEYIIGVDNLDNGIIYPEQITEMLPDSISRNIIIKDGYYYHLRRRSKIFTKYQLLNGQLKAIAAIPLNDYGEENYLWVGKDSLLLSGLNTASDAGRYYLLNTQKMTVIASGAFDITRPEGIYKSASIGFVTKRKNSLLVGYTFHPAMENGTYTTSDTMYIATLKFPSMERIAVEKEWRSTYPGGINTIQRNDFTDEQGNFYFMTCPGIAMGHHPTAPTAILRIPANSTETDKNYFFNLSASVIHNHAYGLWYLGKGRALVRSERKDLFTGLSDHYSVPHFEFYLLDIEKQQVIKKLPLPLDKGTRKECVLVNGNTAYIAINNPDSGNYIWKYDIQNDRLSKGLQLSGVTDFILRIDRLQPGTR